MTHEQFQRLVAKCQPHKVFNSDWDTFHSRDFADTLLPNVGGYEGKAFEMYDGAELFNGLQTTKRKLLQLSPDNKLISLVAYTYPKGVKAENKKKAVIPENFEVCIFIEVCEDEKIDFFFKSGVNFKKFLVTYAKNNKTTDLSNSFENRIFKSDITSFKKHFDNTLVHYNLMSFVGKTIGIDLEAVNEKSALKVHILNIKAETNEPANNIKNEIKEQQNKYIVVDFEIQNQPVSIYSIFVYQNGKEIYKLGYLPDITITKHPEKIISDPSKGFNKPGKYQIVWNCTDNGIFDTKSDKDKLTIRIQVTSKFNQIALSESDIVIKNLVDNAEVNNFIIVNDVKLFASEILERQRGFVSKIPKATFDKFSEEEKLILNLPIIMVKLGFIHGALCQIHWLEGSKISLKFPYDFFMSEKRVADIDRKNLESLFDEVEYLSIENIGYSPSNPDAKQLFFYNDSIPTIKDSLDLFNKNISKRKEAGLIGDYDNISTKLIKRKDIFIKENYFQSFSIGSAIGNIDDVGTALGQYSQRCYYKAILSKNTELNQWELNIVEVASRFADAFDFNDNLIDFGPIEYSQPLGCWINDVENPTEPTKGKLPGSKRVCVQNIDYQNLKVKLAGNEKKKIAAIIPNSCNDFFIYSDYKLFKDDFVKKTITIY